MFEEEWKGRKTILLVEDDRSVRELVTIVLRRSGYRVLVATNGARALELWERTVEAIDLLMTDLVMSGGINGMELARRLRGEKQCLKVIVFSGYITDAVRREINDADNMVTLQKPFDQQTLAQAARKLLVLGPT